MKGHGFFRDYAEAAEATGIPEDLIRAYQADIKGNLFVAMTEEGLKVSEDGREWGLVERPEEAGMGENVGRPIYWPGGILIRPPWRVEGMRQDGEWLRASLVVRLTELEGTKIDRCLSCGAEPQSTNYPQDWSDGQPHPLGQG